MHKLELTPEQLTEINTFSGPSIRSPFQIGAVFHNTAIAFGPKKPQISRFAKLRILLGFQYEVGSIIYFDDFSMQILNKKLETTDTVWSQQILYIQIGMFKLREAGHNSPYQYAITVVTPDKIYHFAVNYLEILHQLNDYCKYNHITLEDPFNILDYTDHYRLFEYYNTGTNYADVAIPAGYMLSTDASSK